MIAVTCQEYEKQIAVLRQLAKDLSASGENAYLHQLDVCLQLKNDLIALQN